MGNWHGPDGGENMSRVTLVAQAYVVFLSLALPLILVSVPIVSAKASGPLTCEVYAELNFVKLQWEGYVAGDIEGSLIIHPQGATFPGTTEHYKEVWEITTTGGDKIWLFQEGVWSFRTYKFRSGGTVTAADAPLRSLVGCNARVIGITSPFPAPEVWFVECTLRVQPNA